MAPIKALCSQRFDDWKEKFGPIGLKCKELTGDTLMDDLFEIQYAHIIMTTPVGVILLYYFHGLLENSYFSSPRKNVKRKYKVEKYNCNVIKQTKGKYPGYIRNTYKLIRKRQTTK